MESVMHFVDCDICDGRGCDRCHFDGRIAIADMRSDGPKNLPLLKRVFLFLLWMGVVFIAAWEFFGWVNR
jgi:hypothetical protein